jgi:hypothetical protein
MSWRGAPLLLICLLAAVPAPAQQYPKCDQPLSSATAPIFCQGYYALCIKAPCKLMKGAGGAEIVKCSCVVENGWSMGPAACTDSGRSQTSPPSAKAHLMSTYSNYFNPTEQTLNCQASDTRWAWCYGAACTVDADNKTATCICPMCVSPMSTLGGRCNKDACKDIYSAATQINDAFANQHYWKYLTEQGVPDVPLPAKTCGSIVVAH